MAAGIEPHKLDAMHRRGAFRLPTGKRSSKPGSGASQSKPVFDLHAYDDRVAVGIEDYLEEPVIYSDNCIRNRHSLEEEARQQRYERKIAQHREGSVEPPTPRGNTTLNLASGDAKGDGSKAGEEGDEEASHPHAHLHHESFDEETGEHATVETGLGVAFAWKSPVRHSTAPKMNAVLRRISMPRTLPYYATEEYKALHYNPATRPAVLDCESLVPIIQAASSSSLLQRDMTDALIVLSARGDENKLVFGEAGFNEELLNLVESPDMEVRCNAVQSLANLISSEENRRDFYAMPGSIARFTRLCQAKVVEGTRVQPATVRAMRSAAQAVSQLAHAETTELKAQFVHSGMIKILAHLAKSPDKETRHTAAQGLLWLCRKPGSRSDSWQRPGELNEVKWTSEQLAILVSAADCHDPVVVMQVLLGVRCVCTPASVAIMLARTNILSILCKAMKGHLFQENFPLLMAAVMTLSALSHSPWPQTALEGPDFVPILSHLLGLLPKTQEQVISMQSAKGMMGTWDAATLARKASMLLKSPEASMGLVGEVFPQSFRQLQVLARSANPTQHFHDGCWVRG